MHQRGTHLTRDSQYIYLSQWIGEFSEIEKDDFLQQLLDLYAPGQLAIGPLLAPLKGEKRLTLFDCRVDLLKEWFASWEPAEREEFLTRLKEADGDFMERFEKSKNTPNEAKVIEEFWLRSQPAENATESNGVREDSEDHSLVNGHGLQNGTKGSQDDGRGEEFKATSEPVEETTAEVRDETTETNEPDESAPNAPEDDLVDRLAEAAIDTHDNNGAEGSGEPSSLVDL